MVCTSQDERTDEEEDYYKILELGSDAGPSEIRTAYLRLIKLHHPDKLKPSHHHPASTVHSHSPQQPSPTDHQYAQSLILAYSTLIEPARRIEYDLKRLKSNPAHKQVPSSGSDSKIVSQVLDLSEFTQLTVDQPEEEAPDTVGGGDRFVFPCRCGGQFLISEDQMEADIEIIGCDGCSLTVKVEYQSE
ncbi:hypothetical protein PSTG_00018 [Puccinia striiformis f. sp. tritici PST-78]|uniref:Diphthamide biosynthesis protein 4 n=1 Tax=Puccinia striiformis f. sp. tritici PST-78 TaxID=1165861 RepID=A0A0L0W5E6_9BASI|nr:hypothetical protein PSTG_00018 [Puccinia striiformis f. sp. tritici PST-78]